MKSVLGYLQGLLEDRQHWLLGSAESANQILEMSEAVEVLEQTRYATTFLISRFREAEKQLHCWKQSCLCDIGIL